MIRSLLGNASFSQFFTGNMTWWTTDVDLQTMILSCGATNLIDIKFYENRNNGQSKGFALAVFTAESSVKTVMEKLPQKILHGQQLVVLPYTKASLAKFEDATRRVDQVLVFVPMYSFTLTVVNLKNFHAFQRNEKKDTKKDDQKTPFVGTIRIGMPPQQPLQPGQMTLPPPVPLRPQVQVTLNCYLNGEVTFMSFYINRVLSGSSTDSIVTSTGSSCTNIAAQSAASTVAWSSTNLTTSSAWCT